MNLRNFFKTIANTGLGITGSSLSTIGEVLESRALGATNIDAYLNIANGNLVVRSHFIRCMEGDSPVNLGYTYNSLNGEYGEEAWHFSLRRFKSLPKSVEHVDPKEVAVLIEEDGHESTYYYEQHTSWAGTKTIDTDPVVTYEYQSKEWVLRDRKNYTTEYYNLAGYLVRRRDNKNRITTYHYDERNTPWLLNEIKGPSGVSYHIKRELLPNSQYKVTFLINNQKVQENIFDQGRLIETVISVLLPEKPSVKDVVMTYGYRMDGQSYLQDIFENGEAICQFLYDGEKRIERLTSGHIDHVAGKSSYLISYPSRVQKGTVIHAINRNTRYQIIIDAASRITGVETTQKWFEENQHLITTYSYPNNQSFTIKKPGGHLPEKWMLGMSANGVGQFTRWEGLNGQIKERLFHNNSCNYTGLQAEGCYLNGEPNYNYYVYDYKIGTDEVPILRFTVSTEGRVIEYRPHPTNKNDYTKIVYLNFFEEIKQHQHHSVDVAYTVMMDWSTKQPIDRVQVTDYIHDRNGQLELMKEYGAVGPQFQGIDSDEMGFTLTKHNIFGTLTGRSVSQLLPTMLSEEIYVIDALDRMHQKTDALGYVTTVQHDKGKMITTYPNGKVVTEHVNANGAITAIEETLPNSEEMRSTIIQSAGDLTTVTYHPDGSKTYQFNDAAFHPAYNISKTGQLTKQVTNVEGRYKKTIRYAKLMDTHLLYRDPEGKPLPANQDPLTPPTSYIMRQAVRDSGLTDNDPYNRESYEFLDESGRLRYTVDAEKFIKEIRYDTLDRRVAEISYAKKLTDQQLQQLVNKEDLKLPFDANTDRCVRHFYDYDHFKIATQDGAGYITEFKRNGAGWMTQKIIYATKQPINLDLTDFASIRPASHADDLSTQYFHNARGLLKYEIDAKGYLTHYTYTAGGKIQYKRRYINKVDEQWLASGLDLPPLPAASEEDELIEYRYDPMGRVIEVVNADGLSVKSDFDEMGQLISLVEQDQFLINTTGDHYRASQSQYDGWQQLVSEVNPLLNEKIAVIEQNESLSESDKKAAKQALLDNFTKKHTYNEVGLKVKTITPLDEDDIESQQITYYYYDQEQRPTVWITLLGNGKVAILEKSYNAFNEVIETRRYSQHLAAFSPLLIPTLTGGFLTTDFHHQLIKLRNDDFDPIEKFDYDKRGFLHDHVDVEGHITTTEYNAFEQESLVATDKMSIHRQYEGRGLEVETEKVGGNKKIVVKKKYDHPLKKMTYLCNADCEYKYRLDKLGNIEVVWVKNESDEWVKLSEHEYDAFNRIMLEKDALSQETSHFYVRKDRTHQYVHPVNGVVDMVTSNMKGERIAFQNGSGAKQEWIHAADGQVIRHQDALGCITTSKLNLVGWKKKKTNANGYTTTEKHSVLGQLSSSHSKVDDEELNTSYELNQLGLADVITQPNGQQQFQRFHRSGRLWNVSRMITANQDEGIRHQVYLYNEFGSLLKSYVCVGRDILQEEDRNRDAFDRLTSFVDHANTNKKSTIEYVLDDADRVVLEKDVLGNKTRTIYNPLGQKRFQIDAMGGITEWKYNAQGNRVSEQHLNLSLSTSQMAVLKDDITLDQMKSMVKYTFEDTCIYYVHDEMNRERFKLKVMWNSDRGHYDAVVYETVYNAASEIVKKTTYANKLIVQYPNQLKLAVLEQQLAAIKDNLHDEEIHYIRDAKGQPCFIIDPLGYVVEKKFDEMGLVVAEVKYATGIDTNRFQPITAWTPADFAQQLTVNPGQDRTTFTFRTQLGEPEYVIDAEGAVIYYQYDAMRNKVKQCYFSERLSITPNMSLSDIKLLLARLKMDAKKDAITSFEYNEDGKLVKQIDPLGRSDIFVRDFLGNITKHIDRSGKVWEFTYDEAGRKDKEISPKVTIMTAIQWDPNQPGKLLSCEEKEVSLEKTWAYDGLGRIEKVTEAANTDHAVTQHSAYNACHQVTSQAINQLATHAKYDSQQRKIASRDESGVWTYHVLDETNNERYTISSLGQVTEHQYDTKGKLIADIQYDGLIDLSQITQQQCESTGITVSCIKGLLGNTKKGIETVYERNARGEIICKRTGESVINYQYNAFGDCIKTDTLVNKKTNAINHHYQWFDKRGQVVAIYDGHGLFTRIHRDIFNQVEKEEKWLVKPNQLISEETTLDELDGYYGMLESDQKKTYQYDLLGQKTKETTWHVEDSCVNLDDPVAAIQRQFNQTSLSYSYDERGNCVQVTDDKGQSTFSFYNALDHKIAETGIARDVKLADGQIKKLIPVKTFSVNPQGKIIKTIEHAEGVESVQLGKIPEIVPNPEQDRVTFNLYDENNRLIGHVVDPITTDQPDGEAVCVSDVLNAAGHLLERTLPEGQKERFFYDLVGRQCYMVNGDGGLVEYQYDHLNRRVAEIHYAVSLPREKYAELSTQSSLRDIEEIKLAIQLPDQDKKKVFIYNQYNQCQYTLTVQLHPINGNSVASVTQHEYDAANQETAIISYANWLPIQNDTPTIEGISSQIKLNPMHDRKTHAISDELDRVHYYVDGKGAVIENIYDLSGRIVRKIAYANRLNISLLSDMTVASIKASIKPSTEDRVESWLFNAEGKRTHHIRAAGNVTEYLYNRQGLRVAKIKHADLVNAILPVHELSKQLLGKKTLQEKDRLTQYHINEAGLTTAKIDAHSEKDQYHFDIFNKMVSSTDRAGAVTTRFYDRRGQEIKRLDPSVLVTDSSLVPGQAPTISSKMKSSLTQFKYDKAGNKTEVMIGDEKKRAISSTYNAYHLPLSTRIDGAAVDDHTAQASLTARPEKLISITTQIVRNGRGEKIAEVSPNGQWHFSARDSQGKLIYKLEPMGEGKPALTFAVTHIVYNTFGEQEATYEFIQPIHLTAEQLDQFKQLGPCMKTIASLVKPSDADKVAYIAYDQTGEVEIVKKTKQLAYIPGHVDEKTGLRTDAHQAFAHPETRQLRNSFGEVVAVSELIDPVQQIWSTSHTWMDKNGKPIAEADPNQHIKRTYLNAFGENEKHIEFAQPLVGADRLTLDQLDEKLTTHQDKKDRVTEWVMDHLGQTKQAILRSEIVSSLRHQPGVAPTVSDEVTDLVTEFHHDKVGNQIAIVYPDKEVERFYYNAKKQLIAHIGLPVKNGGERPIALPLTEYSLNDVGDRVAVKKYKLGATSANDTSYTKQDNGEDALAISVFDNRGLEIAVIDAENNVIFKTYTASRQLSRTYHRLTNPDEPVHIDEQRFTYNAADLKESHQYWRDSLPYQADALHGFWTWYDYDTLKRCVAEGSTKAKKEIVRRYHANQLWLTNEDQGVTRICLNNLAGKLTVTIESNADEKDDAHNLAHKTYQDLQELLIHGDQMIYERTEIDRDLAGGMIARSRPQANMPVDTGVRSIYLQMGCVEENGKTWLRWPVGSCQASTIVLNVRDSQQVVERVIQKDGQYYQVDVSDLVSDIYHYQIIYTGGAANLMKYASTGQIQFNTTQPDDGQHITTDLSEGAHCIRLKGPLANVSELQVIDEKTQQMISVAEIRRDKEGCYVNLSYFQTGRYQLKIFGTEEQSLPFQVETANKPLHLHAVPLTISCAIHMKGIEGELKLDLPPEWEKASIRLFIRGYTKNGILRSRTVEIDPSEWEQMASSSTDTFFPNFKFFPPIGAIHALTVELNVGSKEQPEWLRILDDLVPSQVVEKEDMVVSTFPMSKLLLWNQAIRPYHIRCLMPSESGEAAWQVVNCIGSSQQGFVTDITEFKQGDYLFEIDNELTHYVVNEDFTRIYASDDVPLMITQKVQQPMERFVLDAWRNILAHTNTLNHTTQYEFNHGSQEISCTLPEKECWVQVDPNGNDRRIIKKRLAPVHRTHYNHRRGTIAKTDARGSVWGWILEPNNRRFATVLPDGVVSETILADALQNEFAYRDARGAVWQTRHNKNGVRTWKLSPAQRQTTYELNERSEDRVVVLSWPHKNDYISRRDPASPNRANPSFVTRFARDPRGHSTKEWLPEPGYINITQTSRRGQVVSLTHVDGTDAAKNRSVTWMRNYFDIVQSMTDMNGVYHVFGHNLQALETLHQTTSGHPGQTLSLTSSAKGRFHPHLSPMIEAQHIETAYRYKKPVTIWDRATNKTIFLDRDTEGNIIGKRLLGPDNRVLREIITRLDEHGLEVETFDAACHVMLGFDEIGNRRFQRSSLYGGMSVEHWNLFDRAKRVVLTEGVLENGCIELGDHGMALTYVNNFRTQENRVMSNGHRGIVNISYEEDGLPYETNGAEHTIRLYDVRCMQDDYYDGKGWTFRVTNGNGWLIGQKGTHDYKATVDFSRFTVMGQPHRQDINYHDDDRTAFYDSEIETALLDYKVNIVRGRNSRRRWKGAETSLTNTYDPNLRQNGVLYPIPHGDNGFETQIQFFDSMPTGEILNNIKLEMRFAKIKMSGFELDFPMGFYLQGTEQFIYSTSGVPLVQYHGNGQLTQVSSQLTGINQRGGFALVPTAEGSLQNADEIRSISASYPPPAPSRYPITQDGETYTNIAKNALHDPGLAYLLAAYNGDSVDANLDGRTEIKIPSLIEQFKNSSTSLPYDAFTSSLREHLLPYLPAVPPQEEHQSFLRMIVPVVAVAVACIVAPHLAPYVMNGLGIGGAGAGMAAGAGAATVGASAGTAAVATTTGVTITGHVVQAAIAGLVNAGIQGVAIGAGMQDKFSYGQVLNSMTAMGISGGATSLTEGLGAVASQVSKVALANVAEQLVLLKVGAIDKFSLENVLQSVGATLTGMGVNAVLGKVGAPMKNPYVNAGAGLASSAVTQQLTTHHLQMDALAQQAVGAGIQLSADHYLAAKQSNRELKDQQASTPHKVRKQAPGQHKPVHPVHGHEVMNDPALQIAKPSQNGLFGRSPSAPGTMYVPEPRLETEAIGYQLSEQNRARMQQHQASSSSASGSKRHLFAIPSPERTGSLADVTMHKPAGYTQQVISDRYHVLDQKWQVTTRTLGALQAIGGGLEVSFGVELAATGVGAIPGALLVGSGIDNLGAGAHTFISGHSQQTTLGMVMTQNGVSAGNAATMQAGADFALNLGGTAALHAPEMYQMGAKLVSSLTEPVSQVVQKMGYVVGGHVGEIYRQYPGRAGWSFFAGSKKDIDTVLFENQFPQDEIYLPKIIPTQQLSNYTGRLNYVVMKDGSLIVGKRGDFPGGGHIDLANGMPVQAAGEIKLVNGCLKYIDNSSGHYLPHGDSVKLVAEKAFQRANFESEGKYLEKIWEEDVVLGKGGAWRLRG